MLLNKNKNNIAIVVGANHFNSLWVVRSLGLVGFKVLLVIYKGDHNKPSFVSKSKYVEKCIYINDNVVLTDTLLKTDYDKDTPIITTSDIAAKDIDQNYDELKCKFRLANCGNEGNLSYFQNKDNVLNLAKDIGIHVPETHKIKTTSMDHSDILMNSFPCIIKPANSSKGSKSDYRICDDKISFQQAIGELRNTCEEVLVQEYIIPDFELCLIGCSDSQRKEVSICGIVKKIHTCQSIYNLGMISYVHLENNINNYINENLIILLINKLGYDGIFSVEFLYKKGKAYLLEVNLRTDANLFVYSEGGVNWPAVWLKRADIPNRAKEIYGMVEISYLKYLPCKNPIKLLKEWWKTDCYSIFSWRDPLPFIYKFIYALC